MNVKDTKKYQEAIQWRDWQTCDLIAEEHEALVNQLKEANEKLAEKYEVITSQEKERQSTERFWKEKLVQLEQRLKEAEELLRDLNKGVVRYYDETCSKVKWDTCCNGRDCACLGKPTDPDYYIWQDLLKVSAYLAKHEAKQEEI